MKKLTIRIMSLLAILIFAAACSTDDSDLADLIDDDDNTTPGTPGSLTAKVSGNSFSSSGLFTTASLSYGDNGSFVLGIAGVRIVNGLTHGIVLACTGTDFSSVKAGDTFSSADSDRLFIGGYSVGDSEDNNDISAGSDWELPATLTITKIDRDRKLISGTFSFDAIDESEELTYEIRDGVFTDIEYD